MQHVGIEIGVGARRPAEPADIIGDHAARVGTQHVAAEALGVADPVVARRRIQGVESLVDQQHDGVAVIGRDRIAVLVMGVPGVVGHPADADHVGVHEVAYRLDVFGERPGIVRDRRLAPGHFAVMHGEMGAAHLAHGAGEGDLGDEARPLALRLRPQVAGQRPGEEVGALGHARHMVRDPGGGPRHPLDLLHRITAEMGRAPAPGEPPDHQRDPLVRRRFHLSGNCFRTCCKRPRRGHRSARSGGG